MKDNLLEMDHLEIQDLEHEELMKYSKKELIALIGSMALEMHEMERKQS